MNILELEDSYCFEPQTQTENTPCFVISFGIHGNETAPIECCFQLISELLSGKWQVACPVLFLFGNPEAAKKQVRFCDENLNRLFPSQIDSQGIPPSQNHGMLETSNLEKMRAKLLQTRINQFKSAHPNQPLFHYDLHTAIRDSYVERFALRPFILNRTPCTHTQKAVLASMGIEVLLEQHKPATTFASWTALTHLATSFTLELGKVHPFGENDLSKFKNVINTLRALLTNDLPSNLSHSVAIDKIKIYKVCHEIIHTGEDFHFYIDDATPNFTVYKKGYRIWSSNKEEYSVTRDAEWIVFPNRHVPKGQRAGLMVCEATNSSAHI
jgi:succinylglutamate desuccinylase